MVKFDVKLQRFRDVETGQLVSARIFRNIFHAAASIAKDAKRSIKTSPRASKVGQPPHTRRGRNILRRAIRYKATKQPTPYAVIGPMASRVGKSAAAHELGQSYKGQSFPERPFMRPALERNLHRMGGQFTGTIGG